MKPYKMNENHLDCKGGIHKLEKDGFTRRDIIDYMYKATPGLSKQKRTELVERLYSRECK